MKTMRSYLSVFVLISWTLLSPVSAKSTNPSNPIEVGTIKWLRNLDTALQQSVDEKKPIFLLFQEVPGCAGCQKFGSEVLSHPLLVEAIERHFVPLLIHNNKGGYDAEILQRYREPAWNYQVVRFLDSQGKDIISRKDKIWNIASQSKRMIAALAQSKMEVPLYLQSIAQTSNISTYQTAAFAQHCFWTGEYKLGAINGVVSTEAGWIDGLEVTKVTFDPTLISFPNLKAKAEKARCASTSFSPKDFSRAKYRAARPSDQKKQLSGVKLPPNLNAVQLCKLNAFLRSKPQQALAWLSPNQKR